MCKDGLIQLVEPLLYTCNLVTGEMRAVVITEVHFIHANSLEVSSIEVVSYTEYLLIILRGSTRHLLYQGEICVE